MDLSTATCLVTGGSSGIGLATARSLRERGARVALCGRREAPLREAAEAVGALAVAGDVGVEADAIRIVQTVLAEFGHFDALINNAGWGVFRPLLEVSLDDFRAVMETNVYGAMLMARESAKHFKERGGGSIVNVASTAALKGFVGGTAYAATKFALRAMTECWRDELRQHDIRVMQVNPSEVQTQFAPNAGYEQVHNPRKLQADDIAHAICAMLSMDDRAFTTEMTVFATNPDAAAPRHT